MMEGFCDFGVWAVSFVQCLLYALYLGQPKVKLFLTTVTADCLMKALFNLWRLLLASCFR